MKTFLSRFSKPAMLSLFLGFSLHAFAQFEIDNAEYIDQVKGGTTYVAMHDTSSIAAREYKAIYRKYWTFSKLQFINYADVSKHIQKGNTFLSIGGFVTETQFITLYSSGASRNGIDYSTTHLFLEFWTASDKFFDKGKKEMADKDKVRIGRVELFTDFPTLSEPKNIYKEDYDGGGHIRNWGPGILKNYIQVLNSLLTKKEERKLYKNDADPEKLKSLRKETLYVPDYVLIKFNKFTGDESEKHDEKDIFRDYKYSYKLISTEDLNKMILSSDDKPFYYMVYIKSSTDKFITVINSKTGEFIYTEYTPVSYNITSKDMKKLSSAVGG